MAKCIVCEAQYSERRAELGYQTCLDCGALEAKHQTDKLKQCSAPLFSKGAYQPVLSREDARNINSKHWNK